MKLSASVAFLIVPMTSCVNTSHGYQPSPPGCCWTMDADMVLIGSPLPVVAAQAVSPQHWGSQALTSKLLFMVSGIMDINRDLVYGRVTDTGMAIGSSPHSSDIMASLAAWPLYTIVSTGCGLDRPWHLCGLWWHNWSRYYRPQL